MSDNNIELQKFNLDKIFNQRWYNVPNYQRPYVWGSEQVLVLLNDLYDSCSNEKKEYFLGSIILSRKNDTEEFDILDGQQRLTTFLLILIVFKKIYMNTGKDFKEISEISELLKQERNELRKIPEKSRITFEIRKDVDIFINEHLIKNEKEDLNSIINNYKNEKDISIKHMCEVLESIFKFLNENCIKNETKFLSYLLHNTTIIFLSTNNFDNAFRLFEIMNDRGIKLRNSDILKASNLSEIESEKKREEYAKEWEDMEKYFEEKFDNFLSHIRTILVKQKATDGLKKEFEEKIYNNKKLKKGEETFKLIKNYYDHYTLLFDELEKTKIKEFNQIKLMEKGLEADIWIPVLLKYYDKFKEVNLYNFLLKLDRKISADWILRETPTNRIENMIAIIKKIDDENLNCNELLQNKVFDIKNKEELKNILSADIYGERFAKYLLLKLSLNKHDSECPFSLPEIISIEHILPQTPKNDSQWLKDFNEEEVKNTKHKIGNLILLSRRKNSSQGNFDYTKKKEKYFKEKIQNIALSNFIIAEYNTWTKKDFNKNQEEQLKELFKLYDIN